VAIDYPAALVLRQIAARHDEYPQYLPEPEISALLQYVPDLHRKMLFTTLWNTGVKWFTEFGHLNRGDMLTSEQYRCTNETKKF